MTGSSPLFAAGGWLETNTFGARINFILDGVTVVDFEGFPLDYAHQFYGVIETDGFLSCEVRETEAMPGDEWYYVFGDDFTFAIELALSVDDEFPVSNLHLRAAPNPFNPHTLVSFTLSHPDRVELVVWDARGRRVTTLASGDFAAGRHEVAWNGRDARGRAVPAGLYIARVSTAGSVEAVKLMLVE